MIYHLAKTFFAIFSSELSYWPQKGQNLVFRIFFEAAYFFITLKDSLKKSISKNLFWRILVYWDILAGEQEQNLMWSILSTEFLETWKITMETGGFVRRANHTNLCANINSYSSWTFSLNLIVHTLVIFQNNEVTKPMSWTRCHTLKTR